MAKFNDEMKNKLYLLRREGLGCRRISEELEVSRATVSRWLKRCGLNQKLTDYKPLGKHLITCLNCRKEKYSVKPTAKFCSERCRSKYNKKHRGHKWTCRKCKKVYVSYKEKAFCSDKCKDKYMYSVKRQREYVCAIGRLKRTLKRISDCEYCGVRFISNVRNSTVCKSSKCYHLHTYTPKKHAHKCRECGKHYSDTQKNSAGCSDKCKKKWANRMKETTRRKKVRENGRIDWAISVERLVKRDKGYCYLCGDKVNINDYVTLDNGTIVAGESYPSIDHVVPVSKGGTHTWNNVRLAHRFCNSIKGNEIV